MLKTPAPVNDGSSYRALAFPTESFNDADRALVTNPADSPGSPFGWHDTNGAAGPEFTTTQGNNAHAYMDQDDNNAPDFNSSPDGGASLTFDFPIDTNEHAQNYRSAATANLFYANNMIHDLLHRYGFDEASGNFQANNYGKGGTGTDYVRAEAADGNGTNNAMFGTPTQDGGTPRMQMYLWPGNQFGSQNRSPSTASARSTRDGRASRPRPPWPGCRAARWSTAAPAARRTQYPTPLPTGNWIAVADGGTAAAQCPYLQRAQVAADARRQGARDRPQRDGRRAGADRRDDRRGGHDPGGRGHAGRRHRDQGRDRRRPEDRQPGQAPEPSGHP